MRASPRSLLALLPPLVLAAVVSGDASADPTPPATPASSAGASSSTATVPFTGSVLRRGDRSPIPDVTVVLDDGDALQAVTDAAGRFAFDAVPVGAHHLHLRGKDIAPVDLDETLTAGKKLDVTYRVNAKEAYTTTVKTQRIERETVEQTLTTDEIKHIPGTQGDTLKAVQNLPGVARAPFGIGQLIVWGSAPQDTRVYVDGVFIPTLYHFGGLRSTVNGDLVDSLTFLPGGYNVEYGRGLGGAVEVESRRPRDGGYHGFLQIDLIDGSLSLEGPITKKLSFAVAARRSWIDVFLPLLTPNDFQLTPRYWDYQAKLRYRASPRDDLDVFLFGSDDSVTLVAKNGKDPALSAQFDSHIYFHRLLASWRHRFLGRATLQVTASTGYDVPFEFAGTFFGTHIAVDAETFEYNLRAIARVPVTDFLRVDAGLDFEGNRWSLSALSPLSGMPRGGNMGPDGGSSAFGKESGPLDLDGIAPYVTLAFSFLDRRLLINPSLRLETFAFTGATDWTLGGTSGHAEFSHAYFRPEPRLSLRWQASERVALKGSIGVYHQAPDPSAFFHLFGNDALPPSFGVHYVAGAEARITSDLSIDVEGFYKDLRDLIVTAERAGDPILSPDGEGRVYGGQLILRQALWKNLFGWVAYTLSRSERKEHADVPWHLFQFDQTHILTVVASYRLPRGYQVGVRFRYVTGNPTTPVIGAYNNLTGADDQYVPIRGALYSDRLGSFNQLDVRFDKTWTYDYWKLSLYLDIQNVYNAANPEGYRYNYNYTQRSPVSSLPFLPALGVRGDF